MKKLLLISMAFAVGFSVTRCTSSTNSGSEEVSYTAGGQAFKAVDTALGNAEGMISGSARSSGKPVQIMAGGLNTHWETAGAYPNPKYNPSECPTSTETANITLKDYMGTQFESDERRCNGSAINIFGRLENAAGIICIMMNQLSAATSAEMASAADFTFTMDAATKADLTTKCPMMAADLANESAVPTGTVITIEFDAPSVTTTYDLKATIQPFNNTVFLKYGGTEINFANNEDNSNGNQRVLVSYNSTTQVVRAEYVSKAKYTTDAPLYIHRLYMDDINQEARIVSSILTGYTSQNDTSEARSETYIISGHPSSTSIALSMNLLDMGSIPNGAYEACVNGDTGVITNDNPTVSTNSFSCGTTASTSKDTSYATAISTINGQTDDSTPTTWWVLSTGSEALNWTTRDNMLTQGL
jgi:hypothetical protein